MLGHILKLFYNFIKICMYIGFVKDYEVVVLYYLINKLNHKLFVNCFPFKGKVNYIR